MSLRSQHTQSQSAKEPRLLQQMRMLLQNWKDEPVAAPAAADSPAAGSLSSTVPNVTAAGRATPAANIMTPWERRMMNQSTAEAVLKLYAASAGVYEPLLKDLIAFQSELIDDLVVQLRQVHGTVAVYQSKLEGPPSQPQSFAGPSSDHSGAVPRTLSAPAAGPDGELSDRSTLPSVAGDKCDYAFGRVAVTQKRMEGVVATAKARQSEAEARIATLEAEVAHLETQLKDQMTKLRKATKDPGAEQEITREELMQERRKLDLEAALRLEQENVRERDSIIDSMTAKQTNLLQLNAKYARQAVELVARVRVYAEHNDKFATLLSMQHDDKIAIERENKLLKKELIDLNKFHQIRDDLEGDSDSVLQPVEARGIRYGRGLNPTVPRHLHFTGLMNRVPMAKEMATSIIAEVLTQRRNPRAERDFNKFLYLYMKQRFEAHAVAWCYGLDEATRFFDSDVNLNLFGMVSRRELPEAVYSEVLTDQRMFLAGCEAMDILQHGSQRMTIPLPHIAAFLLEMYPGYKDVAFRRMIDHLQQTLTTNGQAHYRMLFPNMEREEFANPDTVLTQVDMRKENGFSCAFKELTIDDVHVSLQLLEDEVQRTQADKLSLADVKEIVRKVFPIEGIAREVFAMLRKGFLDHLGSSGNYAVSMPKDKFVVNVLRTQAPVRRGVFRTDSAAAVAGLRRKELMQYAAGRGEVGKTILESLTDIDYRDVLLKLPDKLRRTSYITEEDLRAEEDDRRRRAELASDTAGGTVGVAEVASPNAGEGTAQTW
jgi:uncharacterized small protein (DUF1192 family)